MVRWAEAGDREAIRELWRLRFGDSEAFLDWFFGERFSPATSAVSLEEGRLVCSVQSLPTRLRVRDGVVGAALVSGVSTLPDYEGRGHMGRTMRFLMNGLAGLVEAVAVYKPLDFRVYEGFGHYPVADALYFEHAEPERDAAEGGVEVCGLEEVEAESYGFYSRVKTRYSGIMDRSPADQRLRLADYTCDGGRLYALRANDGLAAYAAAEPDGEWLTVRELVSAGGEAEDRLLRALCRAAAERGLRLRGRLPCDSKPSLAGLKTELRPSCAAGAADIQRLMAAAIGDGGYTVAVRDKNVAINNGVFDLAGRESGERPCLSIEAGRLLQFLIGYRSLAELEREGHAEVYDRGAVEALDCAYTKRKCFIWEEY